MKSPSKRAGSHQAEPSPRENGDDGIGLVRFVLTFVLLAWAIRSLVVAPFSIPSGSMLPTLYIGDYLFVAKWPYGYSRYSFPLQFPPIPGRFLGHLPRRGDIVVFRHPVEDADLIKRVIGLPGDTIEVRAGAVVLNGHPLRRDHPARYRLPIGPNTPCKTAAPALPEIVQVEGRPYCVFNTYRETMPDGRFHTVIDQVRDGLGDTFGPVTVPDGHVFLMGDNRDDSADSRFSTANRGVGMLPVDHLIGRAALTFWSTDGDADYINPISWFTALRTRRIGNGFQGEAE